MDEVRNSGGAKTVNLRATDQSVRIEPEWLTAEQQGRLDTVLRVHRAHFEAGSHIVAGRQVSTPRLVVAFGNDDYVYPDLGGSLPWPDALRRVRDRLQAAAGHPFNCALVNWYRDGRDFAGWHADKIELHVPGTEIAIVSLGATRNLVFRPSASTVPLTAVTLQSGSLLWMSCELQKHVEHAVLPAPEQMGDRFSLTFRYVVPPSP